MTMIYTHAFPTPLGPMLAAVNADGALVRLAFHLPGRDPLAGAGPTVAAAEPCRPVVEQVERYFRGEIRGFDLPLAPRGTDFQHRVWEALRRIPFGETVSYGELARRLGSPGASRAIGRANATNPIPIVVPCHRVVGADGSLTGFAGGVERKRWLLRHEAALTDDPLAALRPAPPPEPPPRPAAARSPSAG